MHKKVFKILGTVFFSVGILVMIAGVFLGIRHWNIVQNSDSVTATITSIRTERVRDIDRVQQEDGVLGPEYRGVVYVEYEVGNRTINARLNWFSTNMRVGGNVNLLVSRDDPYAIAADGIVGWLPGIIPMFTGVIFFSIGAIFLLYIRRKAKLRNWLLQHGTPVWADVVGTEENWKVVVNGRPATVLVATYNNMRFTSGSLSNKELQHVGERVKILIHPDDPDKYVFEF
ncbi:MAG: DUF3592 domain-containing protein [Oscillospiraceae bacterium]|nr:DUF3592 domain-containing protein [Oscillospiraceae bacterium]